MQQVSVEEMFRVMTEETKEKIRIALDRDVPEDELMFVLNSWAVIRMHRDLAVGLSDDAVDQRCMMCASSVYLHAARREPR